MKQLFLSLKWAGSFKTRCAGVRKTYIHCTWQCNSEHSSRVFRRYWAEILVRSQMRISLGFLILFRLNTVILPKTNLSPIPSNSSSFMIHNHQVIWSYKSTDKESYNKTWNKETLIFQILIPQNAPLTTEQSHCDKAAPYCVDEIPPQELIFY